ncbi:MAG: PQQ-dependent sugar dehydrogenase [Gemmatimonadetes bacterium]|nr:PQQ-dependent sugar dehydrogenase [Gemmatimonadota bacterium]
MAPAFRLRPAVTWSVGVLTLLAVGADVGYAQVPPQGSSRVFDTSRERFRVVTVSDKLDRPWSLAFLPDGSMLITEREGRLRIVRNGVLDPQPIAGLPKVQPGGSAGRRNGLMDIAIHPRFAENGLIYITYTKPGEHGAITTALLRARYDGGHALADVREVFVADAWTDSSISQTAASRIVFGRDGMVYMSIGAPNAPASSGVFADTRGGRAQEPGNHGGKVLRLRDDGSVPNDNPFVGRAGYKPEIFTLGHRNILGMVVHPVTGAIWTSEAGPRDGDEVNILKAGANYGWPTVGIGRDYTGDWIGSPVAAGAKAGRADAQRFWMEGMEQPFLFWVPAVTPAGMVFYTGDRFPGWKGSLFIGILSDARVERYGFNARGDPAGAENLLGEYGQRIRDVRQGPDGLLYLLTDHKAPLRGSSGVSTDPGYLFRIQPAK